MKRRDFVKTASAGSLTARDVELRKFPQGVLAKLHVLSEEIVAKLAEKVLWRLTFTIRIRRLEIRWWLGIKSRNRPT
jgi:hypothetical protein